MKILELRFKNLNSLYGEWSIDFTNPEYATNGIFAITGPTGAGKSTILDAICLALYGRTPRLGLITKSDNELMSRQTGECRAEVVFETQHGTFRTSWSQHRARKKANGNLTEPKHEISNAITGDILEEKKSRVSGVVEEKTGLNFDRFTRSILLAQGNFAAFLKSDSNDRSSILEQITGTEVYSEISMRVHNRQRAESKTLELLQTEVSGVKVLTAEEEAALTTKGTENKSTLDTLTVQKEKLQQGLTWLEVVAQLEKDVTAIKSEEKQLLEQVESFKSDTHRLHRAQQAATLDGEFAGLVSKRNERIADVESLKKGEALLPTVIETLSRNEKELTESELKGTEAKEALKKELDVIKGVREHDLIMGEKKIALAVEASELQKIAIQLSDAEANKRELDKKSTALTEESESIATYCETHAGDALLISQSGTITDQVTALVDSRKLLQDEKNEVAEQQQQCDTDTRKMAELTQEGKAQKKAHSDLLKSVAEVKKALADALAGKDLKDYQYDREMMIKQQGHQKVIASLEEHRDALVDGEDCPLCGSTEHPYAEWNVPSSDTLGDSITEITLFIGKIENLLLKVAGLENDEQKSVLALVEQDKKVGILEVTIRESNDALSKMITHQQELELKRSTIRQQVIQKVEPFGITITEETDLLKVLTEVESRLAQWNKNTTQNEAIEKEQNLLLQELKQVEGVMETLTSSITEREAKRKGSQAELDSIIAQRTEMYGDKNPDAEEKRFEESVTKSEQKVLLVQESVAVEKKKLYQYQERVNTLTESIATQKPLLEVQEAAFSNQYSTLGFDDEDSFITSRMESKERAALEAKARSLKDAEVAVVTRKNECENRLTKEKSKVVTLQSAEDITAELGELNHELNAVTEEATTIKVQLSANEQAQKQIAEKRGEIDAQKRECSRWDVLHSLIGSADGKKFRNFAQGLTFEMMVSHANKQLQKMSDRYLLVRDESSPLELNIIDNYQAGEERSTKNLSGGESFIVSLALALGLSKMASKKVRVDSLFLDEGFGTLDEEALETALETLSGLQQEGKLIGVISHVPALKARIGTQIVIHTRSGGKSSIEGAGCVSVTA
ncbi:MAG: AAA family ATPase [Reichenbachiella sp.]